MNVEYFLKKFKNPNLKKLLELYCRNFPERDVLLLRVPARINLLGTHIEHRGGFVNYLAIDKNLWVIAAPRKDSRVVALNLDAEYPAVQFEISDIAPPEKMTWENFVRTVKITPGAWENYIKAPFSFLQSRFQPKKLSGLNLCFFGNIPVGAGLSSSSTIVVATTLLAARANGLQVSKEELVEIAGRSEWYVGTRGGWGDHAAMIFGRSAAISRLQFFPFRVQYLPFPVDYQVICADSLVEAKKASGARSIFNERITCYEIGLTLIKRNFPKFSSRLEFLRDVNAQNLDGEAIIYEMLLTLPEKITRRELRELLPDGKERLDVLFETHPPPAYYRIRDVVFYGISECERTRICKKFLKTGALKDFGKLMYVSHDGDRVVKYKNDNSSVTWNWKATNAYVAELKKKAASRNSAVRKEAAICFQPGAYRCSTPELDFIVDTAEKIPGVIGAKLTGGGLGGCVLILVKKEQAEEALETIKEKYYRKRNLPETIFICNSTGGAEFL